MSKTKLRYYWFDVFTPNNVNPVPFFKELKKLNDYLQLSDLSMGMSSDFIEAVENHSTFLRIGSNIFGQRS